VTNTNTKDTPWYSSQQGLIASVSIIAITATVICKLTGEQLYAYQSYPLFVAFIIGGIPILFDLGRKILKGQFGSDILAGLSIITSIILGEYLAGTLIILMLSGGEALEEYALKRASSVLDALANRMPNLARLKTGETVKEVQLSTIQLGDQLQILPHNICPVDGEVIEGFGVMDESFLTGEPYQMQKAPGSSVISGALNGESAFVIRATKLPSDSRYQKIAKVIEEQASKQVPMKRLADRMGSWYTPLALFIALTAWALSGNPDRFLAVLVTATPCPLLIAVPVALIGSISSAAARGIIIKNPAVLEHLATCRTMIMDKTGTLTYGKPSLTSIVAVTPDQSSDEILAKVAALEVYSKHPLADSIIQAAKAKSLSIKPIKSVSERPGQGLSGTLDNKLIAITSRTKLGQIAATLPAAKEGLECIVTEDGAPLAVLSFRDIPRKESRNFVAHAAIHHDINRIRILSGDRISEVKHLAELVGITDIEGGMSPEGKLVEIKRHTSEGPTVYIGDGINDAPALQAATVGIAIGTNSDITSEAADAVIMDPTLEKVDELFHLSRRMRTIAFQSALGGMTFSVIAMGFASFGMLTPLAGAILQEIIDIVAVLNSLRTAFPATVKHHSLA
jgi:heavy metal translocating P-type ATPase